MVKMKPLVIINFKRLEGNEAVHLAKKLEEISPRFLERFEISIAIKPQDLVNIPNYKLKIILQDTFSNNEFDLDHYFEDRINILNPVYGVILNHPEKKMNSHVLDKHILNCTKHGLVTIICSTGIENAIKLNNYNPDYIGIESEFLIGKRESFNNYCPEIVKDAKSLINTNILIGAGITNSEDFQKVLKDGGSGILISSLILNSVDPKIALESLLSENNEIIKNYYE